MGLSNEEVNLLIKIYIGQRVREEGLVDASLNSEDKLYLPSLKEKQLINYSIWKPFKNYTLYKTTEAGNKIASTYIQEILHKSNLANDIQKIPLIFLKLCFFMDELFYMHELDLVFEDFYWDEAKKEFLIEKGLKYWNNLIELFKAKTICVQSYYYVSTRGGELRELYNILPKPEIKEFLKKNFGIIEGVPEDILKRIGEDRQKILKRRENMLFEEIIDDFSPKYVKVIEQDEKEFIPIKDEKGILIFMSYSTKDEGKYGIKKIAEKLTAYKDIEDALYWQEDLNDNIYEYMDVNIGKCEVFILFCSPQALISDPIKKEWTAADMIGKPIVPVFLDLNHIPPLLRSRLALEFDLMDFDKNVVQLHNLILKK